jgi:hypothetical protein
MDGARVDKEQKKSCTSDPLLIQHPQIEPYEKRIPNNNEIQVLVFAEDELCSLGAIVVW